MKIRKNRALIVFLAAMLLFSNVAAAVNLCLMEEAGTSHEVAVASDDEPCCGAAEEQNRLPDNCCAVLAMEHRNDAPPFAGAYTPPAVVQFVPFVLRLAPWDEHRPGASTPALRIAGPPLNLLFKNFRI